LTNCAAAGRKEQRQLNKQYEHAGVKAQQFKLTLEATASREVRRATTAAKEGDVPVPVVAALANEPEL